MRKESNRNTIVRWKKIVAEFQSPNVWRASWQLVNTLGGLTLLWILMYFSLQVSWWLTIPLAVLAGGFLVRVFIIFHDCGHGAFFKSKRANDFWGCLTGILVFTPYYHWRWEHSIHHSTNGDLDQRGVGDVWTMTVEEYLDSPQRKRLAYRLVRNPFVLFVIAPIYLFLIRERWPIQNAKPREVRSVRFTNLAIACMAGLLIAVFGFWQWLAIQLILTVVSGGGGIWLFYIQHQYEGTYWERSEDWDYTDAALKGSSYYKLPRILQWFSGNIGFHHIHHLSPRIPNYHLEACHHSDPIFSEVVPTTILGSLKALTFRLWDEERKELISFRQLNDQLKAEREAVG